MVGKTLGHYEILEPLGAGGMGEVYRARDTKLDRDVAIKVLPEDFANDPGRVARLEREAKLLAALNHPNIATVHALEAEEGACFLVLELVKGESLEQKLATGPLPVEKALDVCKQIAEALEAAHAAAIIHRDLKPANVLLTSDGRAKVLDFGIAKSMELGDDVVSDTAKVTNLTAAGTLVGTPAYMSPEQIRGEEIDKRADIWAFGCVLYETLTARSAFAKETMADTLAAIVDQEPDWSALPDQVPRQLRHLIERCLRKDPQRRLRDIGDARIEIEDSLSGDTDAVSAMPAAPAVAETTRAIPWKLAAPVAVAIALLAAFGVWISIPSPPESLISRFYIDYPPETTFQSTSTLAVAISPDGRSVVFNADRQLWLRAIDDLVATPIRGTEQATVPFFSPDGQQLGFWGGDGQIKSVSITGGAPVSLGPAPVPAYGASWADDGYIYFGQGPGGIWRVSESGGDPEVVVQMEEGEQAHGPQLLPGGEWLLFTLLSGSGSWNDASIVVQPVSGGERKPLVPGGTDGRYVPTGHIVYALDGNLFAVPFDADNVEVTGGSASIVEGVQQAIRVTGAGQYAFSDRGGLVYMPGGGVTGASQLIWLDRDGQVELLPFEPRSSQNLALSPDGQRIALQIQGDDGEWDIWIYEIERGGSQVLLTTEGNNRYPVWSPDGEWVFFRSDRGGNNDIWKRRADQSLDAAQVLTTAADDVRPSSISADGERLLFDSGLFPNRDVGMLALDTDQEPEMLVATAADELQGSFSPDGRFFAFESNETGQREVMVRELSSGRTFPVSTSTRGGIGPRWSRDGTEIYYRSRIGSSILVAEVAMEPFSASDPLELLDIIHRSGVHFDVTADGQRFLVTVPVDSGHTGDTAPGARLNVVLNWFEELKQWVPTGGRR